MSTWSPDSWKKKPASQAVDYDDPDALAQCTARLRSLPPLVTSFEIERLRQLLSEAERGERFLLQGGDCAESLADCRSEAIAAKLKILLQMSLVLVAELKRNVIRVGRFAGQYAKPRSHPTETQGHLTLPSYFGDLVNRAEFTSEARRADPALLVEGYKHAALTLNFIRSLTAGGFADLQHSEWWSLKDGGFELPGVLRRKYEATAARARDSREFSRLYGDVEFFTSHEGLNLHYESALARQVPRRVGFYDLSTHLPWIGDRTRQVDGAHVEFFRGLQNPVGIKVSSRTDPLEIVEVMKMLNPANESGKLVLICRFGAAEAETGLSNLLAAVTRSKLRALWICDPMHGNTRGTNSGFKTRHFDDILRELDAQMYVHQQFGTVFGGVHFELTGENVTECVGGIDGPEEIDLPRNYATLCDPRLNYQQSLEIAFDIAERWPFSP